MQDQRNRYFDFIRGIAIMMVVAIHTAPTLTDYGSMGSIAFIAFRQILNCAVPLFLAISGYFIAKKDLSVSPQCRSFWRKQIQTVYIPCLIFSLGWFVLDILAHGIDNSLYKLLMVVTCGYSIYYFIALIIQFYLITPWLLTINKRGGVFMAATLSAISIIAVTYMLQIEGKFFPLIVYAGPFVLWIVFFMMGIWVSTHSRNYSLIPAIAIVILGLIASVIESKYYLPLHGGGLGIKLSSFVFSAGMILLLFSEKVERLYADILITQIVLYIGEISFGIYLLHMYVRIAIGYLRINSWSIEWTVTLVLTVAIIALTKRVLPRSITKKYLGFR